MGDDTQPAMVIRSADETVTFALRPSGDLPTSTHRAELRTEDLAASALVDLDGADLVRFFGSMAADWKGWSGERYFEAGGDAMDVFSRLRLKATINQRGQVLLLVALGMPWLPSEPDLAYDTHIGPGRFDAPIVGDPPSGAWAVEAVCILESSQLDDLAAASTRFAEQTGGPSSG